MQRAALLFLLLSACAAQPMKPCPTLQARMVETPRGPFFLLDTDDVKALMARMKGLWARTCYPEEESDGSNA